jgi:hypothetical protein
MPETRIEVDLLASSGPVRLMLEDVPYDTNDNELLDDTVVTTWNEDQMIKAVFDVLPEDDGAIHVTAREMFEEINRALNQKLEEGEL